MVPVKESMESGEGSPASLLGSPPSSLGCHILSGKPGRRNPDLNGVQSKGRVVELQPWAKREGAEKGGLPKILSKSLSVR